LETLSIPAFLLTPGVRGAREGNIIKLDSEPGKLELDLVLPVQPAAEAFSAYRIRMTTGGREVLSEDNLKTKMSAGRVVVAAILNTKLLSSGDYLLVLSGVDRSERSEDVSGYSFTVR
jgi:hypothetical protein